MSNALGDPKQTFVSALEAFRSDVEGAFLYLQANVTANELAISNADVAKRIDRAALFWNTQQSALQSAAFMSLGRVFDQSSNHNIDRLIASAQANIALFSAHEVRARKMSSSANAENWIDDYMSTIYEPSAKDFRRLRKYVKKYRAAYKDRFRGARNEVYAHTNAIDRLEVEQIFLKADIWVFIRTLMFLSGVHQSLWEMFHNGRKPKFWFPRYSSRSNVNRVRSFAHCDYQLAKRIRESTEKFMLNL